MPFSTPIVLYTMNMLKYSKKELKTVITLKKHSVDQSAICIAVKMNIVFMKNMSKREEMDREKD